MFSCDRDREGIGAVRWFEYTSAKHFIALFPNNSVIARKNTVMVVVDRTVRPSNIQ